MDKIISVSKQKGRKSRWDLYIIHYENNDGEKYEACMFEEEYNVVMFKKHLLEMEISEIDLDKYRELLCKQFTREIVLENS
jgi:hypothetical protein